MDNIHIVKETTLIAEKKPLALVLPYLRSISLETRNKLSKPLKGTLKFCRLQVKFNTRVISLVTLIVTPDYAFY